MLSVQHITVRNGGLDLLVEVPLSSLYVDEAVAGRVTGLLPNITKHICVNDNGERFGDELVGTELPHLLEHVIIEIQGQAYAAADDGSDGAQAPAFSGHTSWAAELADTRAQGIAQMRTTVTFHNDLVALAAVQEAVGLIDWACSENTDGAAGAATEPASPTPDIQATVQRLRAIM
ncbi:MAG: hypothetical protein LUD25_02530 [Coriobacteriaceae bacterium]|nr:hypothetical protein [Coriobacteriaceae bacterium]